MDNMYNPDKLESEAAQKKLMVDTAVDVQTVLQILVEKEICTRDEVNLIRSKVRNSPKYKLAYQYIDNILQASDLYKNNPAEYLKKFMEEKMKGR